MELLSKLDIAPFQALINMIKFTYLEKEEVFRTMVAILSDYDPLDMNMSNKCVHYIQLLLAENEDLSELLLSFLPTPVEDSSSRTELPQDSLRLGVKLQEPPPGVHNRGDCVPSPLFLSPPPGMPHPYIPPPCYFSMPNQAMGLPPISVKNGPQSNTSTTNVVSWAAPYGSYKVVGTYQPCAFPPQLLPPSSMPLLPPSMPYAKLPQHLEQIPVMPNYVPNWYPSTSKFPRIKMKTESTTPKNKSVNPETVSISDTYMDGWTNERSQLSDNQEPVDFSQKPKLELGASVLQPEKKISKPSEECIKNQKSLDKDNIQMLGYLDKSSCPPAHHMKSGVPREITGKSVERENKSNQLPVVPVESAQGGEPLKPHGSVVNSQKPADPSNTSKQGQYSPMPNFANLLSSEPPRKYGFWKVNLKNKYNSDNSKKLRTHQSENPNSAFSAADSTNLSAFPYTQQVVLPDGKMQNLIFEGSSIPVHIQSKKNEDTVSKFQPLKNHSKSTLMKNSEKRIGKKFGGKSLASRVVGRKELGDKSFGEILPRPSQRVMSPGKVKVKQKTTIRVLTETMGSTEPKNFNKQDSNTLMMVNNQMLTFEPSFKCLSNENENKEQNLFSCGKNELMSQNTVKKMRVSNLDGNDLQLSVKQIKPGDSDSCKSRVENIESDSENYGLNKLCVFVNLPQTLTTSKANSTGCGDDSKTYNLRTPTKNNSK